jgi:hypothetical protein
MEPAVVTNEKYMKWVDRFAGLDAQATIDLIRATPLGTAWQVSDLLEMCDTADEARAVLETNPALSAEHAETVRAYAALMAPDPQADALHVSVKAATSPEAARMLFALAPADARDTVAMWLTIDQHDIGVLSSQYREWILGEERQS